jgi:hypothetical protein
VRKLGSYGPNDCFKGLPGCFSLSVESVAASAACSYNTLPVWWVTCSRAIEIIWHAILVYFDVCFLLFLLWSLLACGEKLAIMLIFDRTFDWSCDRSSLEE